jgi:hypothetical protein
MTDWSWVVALADMVMIAFRKSPAEVCVEVEWSGPRKAIRRGTRFCCCSHCPCQLVLDFAEKDTHIDDTLTTLALLKADDLQ